MKRDDLIAYLATRNISLDRPEDTPHLDVFQDMTGGEPVYMVTYHKGEQHEHCMIVEGNMSYINDLEDVSLVVFGNETPESSLGEEGDPFLEQQEAARAKAASKNPRNFGSVQAILDEYPDYPRVNTLGIASFGEFGERVYLTYRPTGYFLCEDGEWRDCSPCPLA